ncbi:hypothetical protein CBL_20956 [Carabus blaptoides fortunei]
MDSKHFESGQGRKLPLHQLLDFMEDNTIEEDATIYLLPPEEQTAETDEDSDRSDDEHEGDINHLGHGLLKTVCELQTQESDWESEDDLPLSSFLQKKTTYYKKTDWVDAQLDVNLVTTCEEILPPDELSRLSNPIDFFNLFFDDNVINNIITQTNIYSSQNNSALNVTRDEILTFLGGLMLSGYAKYPNKRLYWSKQCDVPTILSENIRLKRFESILRNLHLNDNANYNKNDKLYKLRPLISALNENYKKFGGMDEKLSIDESMIPYYGKHYAKQFIRGKPIRFGYKCWAICTSNGYMIASFIYTGKNEASPYREFGLGGEVVLELLKLAGVPPQKGFKIFFDNYFTSVKLLRHLANEGYCASGTVRQGRMDNCPLPDKKFWNKQKRGFAMFKTSEQVTIAQWKDNKVVSGASNYEEPATVYTNRWCRLAKAKVPIPQPAIFSNYNKGMGGVDKMDGLIAAYRTRMRQRNRAKQEAEKRTKEGRIRRRQEQKDALDIIDDSNILYGPGIDDSV